MRLFLPPVATCESTSNLESTRVWDVRPYLFLLAAVLFLGVLAMTALGFLWVFPGKTLRRPFLPRELLSDASIPPVVSERTVQLDDGRYLIQGPGEKEMLAAVAALLRLQRQHGGGFVLVSFPKEFSFHPAGEAFFPDQVITLQHFGQPSPAPP